MLVELQTSIKHKKEKTQVNSHAQPSAERRVSFKTLHKLFFLFIKMFIAYQQKKQIVIQLIF
ncbi:hypothetical protein VN23_04890 [Janthinobacterium sp. B9-8]|nr:hypothetical protein VN23_04890 [Janthinobacterium sp. B9-8]